jgi:hypothetical protein
MATILRFIDISRRSPYQATPIMERLAGEARGSARRGVRFALIDNKGALAMIAAAAWNSSECLPAGT